jgi:hypothetical protein
MQIFQNVKSKSSNHGFTWMVDANGCGNGKCKF